MNIVRIANQLSLLLLLLIATTHTYASENEAEHKSHKSETHEEKSHNHDESEVKSNQKEENENHFELSKKAIKLMEIETIKINKSKKNVFSIPKSALLKFGEHFGVYKYDGEHFELIEIANITTKKSSITFRSKLLNGEDQIVVKGVPLLRVSHLQASGQGGEGHGH